LNGTVHFTIKYSSVLGKNEHPSRFSKTEIFTCWYHYIKLRTITDFALCVNLFYKSVLEVRWISVS
jgi:hypothetical protein